MNVTKRRFPGKVLKPAALCLVLVALSASVFTHFGCRRGTGDQVAGGDRRRGDADRCPAGPTDQVYGDPSTVAEISVFDVDVWANPEIVDKRNASSDCCLAPFCEDQWLEALVPPKEAGGVPSRYEEDGGLPLRRKFCGTVTRYGVWDETDDPRDIMINILPAPDSPYQRFVDPFLNTEDTHVCENDEDTYEPGDDFDLEKCLGAAKDKPWKVIHAEVTPDENFFGADGRFLPIEDGAGLCSGEDGGKWECPSELEPRPREAKPPGGCQQPEERIGGAEICVYGVYALDHGDHKSEDHTQFCSVKDTGHDRPEIHPFDAVWWRHPERKGWIFGAFQDDSNRYSKPNCGSGNGNLWSQAPRDLRYTFPFKFPLRSAPMKVCLQHLRTSLLKDGTPNAVRPMNITTDKFVDSTTEKLALTVQGQTLLELQKEENTERETYVVLVGQIVGDEVVGEIVLHVVVGAGQGANANTLFNELSQITPFVTFEEDDKGAGFYYAQLTFECDCPRELPPRRPL